MKPSTLNILIAISAALAIFCQYTQQYRWFCVLKPLTTVLIIFGAWYFADPKNKAYTKWILMALVFCLIGDTFLLDESKFVFGLGAFLIGHLLFVRSFMEKGGFKANWTTLTPLAVIGTGMYSWFFPHLGELAIPVAVYISVIVIMAWQGVNTYFWKSDKAGMMIGVAVLLFMFSDAVIAINKFIVPFKLSGVVILSTYWLSVGLLGNTTKEYPISNT